MALFYLGAKTSAVSAQNTKHTSLLPAHLKEATVDLSTLFTQNEIKALEKKIKSYEASSSNEIAILTGDAITPYTDIPRYATAIGQL